MYHWIEDKDFLKRMRTECSDVVNRLVQSINNEDYLRVDMQMVGSGAKNLETQNANQPIDLDYNLNIVDINGDLDDCREIKEYVREKFDEVLSEKGWGTCQDSKSALTTRKRPLQKSNKTYFSIDLAIVYENQNGSWFRLIHKKTGRVQEDEWIWNPGPSSKGLNKKICWLKERGFWNEVRSAYLNKKNMYLQRQDNNHPSFNCYIEAVNEIYSKYIG